MKQLILIISICWLSLSLQAQNSLLIAPGSQMVVNGPTQIVLENTRLIQQGTFLAGQSKVIFRGNQATNLSTIDGNTTFYELEIDKTANDLQLLTDIQISQNFIFIQGRLDLNGLQLNLLNSGQILGEDINNYTFSSLTGGELSRQVIYNAPVAEDEGNLGIEITSAANPGQTTIARSHDPFPVGAGSSIDRMYKISPSNNGTLNATIRMYYQDSELNGNDENTLNIFYSTDNGANWSQLAPTTLDATLNYIEISGLDELGWLTASSSITFAVEWLAFNAWVVDEEVRCSWITASEQNSHYFEVEKSRDGFEFESFAYLPARGNSHTHSDYDAVDTQPFPGRSWYRIKEVDLNGTASYSDKVEVNFHGAADFRVFPNPASEQLFVATEAGGDLKLHITISDLIGREVFRNEFQLGRGKHEIALDISDLAVGNYVVRLHTGTRVVQHKLFVR